MVLVKGCDSTGFWVNRFFSDNQDCLEVYVQHCRVASQLFLMLSLRLYVLTPFFFLHMSFLWNIVTSSRLSLSDSHSPSTTPFLMLISQSHMCCRQSLLGSSYVRHFGCNEIVTDVFFLSLSRFHFHTKTESFFNACEKK